jgi:Mg-chelatase subunit ChlD
MPLGAQTGAYAEDATGDTGSEASNRLSFNRYNIVLVTDTSGSMASTDANGLRFEAIGEFVALLAESGNRVGTVVFNNDIAFRQELSDANGIADKRQIISNVSNIPANGYTNIGLGLQTAVEMLDSNRNPDLPSIILVLSDGNTDMASKSEIDTSLAQKADAIDAAFNRGYRIYTVILNADGNANTTELAQVAQATGGEFREVRSAADLPAVFSMYYTLIFSSRQDMGDIKTFPDSGEVNDVFEIPSVGVEEVNIVLSGKSSDYSLTDPSGMTSNKEALAASTYSSDTFNVIKVVGPAPGTWGYTVRGIPGDAVQINIVYNTNISQGIKAIPAQEFYMANEGITIAAYLTEGGQAVSAAQYEGFKARLTIDDGKGGSEAFDMVLGNEGFEYLFTPIQSGTYTVRADISGQDYDLHTGSIMLNIENTPPVAQKDLDETVLIWPFLDNQSTFDLSPCAIDAQDPVLRYEVETSAFLEDEYKLEGQGLTMMAYSLTKGSFVIRAYDSDGAYCTFKVTVSTVNVGLIGVLLLVGGILLALAIIGFILWRALNKRFMGSCYVTQFDEQGNYYEEVRREKGRGRIKLSAFNLKDPGINTSKCYFQASGKNHVFLCTDTKMYGDGRHDKKFLVEGNGYDVTITKEEHGQRGIRVKFVSRLNNNSAYF